MLRFKPTLNFKPKPLTRFRVEFLGRLFKACWGAPGHWALNSRFEHDFKLETVQPYKENLWNPCIQTLCIFTTPLHSRF